MKKGFILILIVCSSIYSVTAQFVNMGQDRPSIRWKQIKTDDFQIIYPDFFETNAQKAANIFARLYHHANTLQIHPKKISVIMHADGGVSNGNVALAPRKSELYTMPSQDPTDSWLEHLCVHEFRHVVQFDKVNQGLTKSFYYIFGEIFPIAVVGLYVPMWFMEGDAVCFETSVGHLGRGRSPEFLNELKAQVLEKGIYSYSKAVLGSFKDFVPDRYTLGYFMTANSRINYGADIWAKALERTGRHPFGITPFNKSLHLTMEGKRDSLWQDSTFRSLFIDPDSVRQANTYANAKRTLYRDNLTELRQRWQQESEIRQSTFDTIATQDKYYTNYYNPIPTPSGELIAYKKGLQQTGAFVRLTGRRDRIITRTGILNDYRFSTAHNKIVWSEYHPHIRWEQGGRMRLSSYDLQKKKYKRHKSQNNRFSPFAAGPYWGCVETDRCNRSYLVLLDSSLTHEIDRIPAQANELFIHPSWHNGKITTVVQSPQGLHLESIDPQTHQRHSLDDAVYYELDYPVATDSLLLYRASYNGNNAFYRWTGQEPANSLNSRFGLQFPNFSPDQKYLYFSFYTSDGYKPGRVAVTALQNTPTTYKQFRLADSMKQQEKWQLPLTDDSVFSSRKYNKFTHLVNIHSWGPLSIDLNDMDVDIGVVAYSQNKLSTLTFTAGYVLKSGYDYGAWILNASYRGWWPIFDLDFYSGKYDYNSLDQGVFLPTKQQESFYTQYKAWRSSAEVTVRLPFNLSARQFNRSLQPYFRYRILGLHSEKMKRLYTYQIQNDKIYITEVDPRYYQVNKPSRYYQLLEYGISFVNQTRMTDQEINPRWGQSISAGYTHSPWKSINLGHQWWAAGRLYIPGLAANHSLSLYGGFQHMSDQTRNYGNNILYPRGISLHGYEISSLRTSYHLPLSFPDQQLGSLFYFKNLNAAVFYDLGTSRNKTGRSVYSSYGLELTTDTHFLRLTYPIHLGIRTGYETQHKKIFADLIFSIGISI